MTMQPPNCDPAQYVNRELSWLEFNQRVLEEAQDPTNPLLERVKFLCIVSSNLDEFFEVRVAGLRQQRSHNISDIGPDGLSPGEQLRAISQRVRTLPPTNTGSGTKTCCRRLNARTFSSCNGTS